MHVINKGWWTAATAKASPNFNARPEGADINLLVIHNISLPPGQFGTGDVCDFFLNSLDCSKDPFYTEIADLKVSAHAFIARDGTVTQFVSFDDRAWHAGRSCFQGQEECNDFSIGIELEGTDDTPYTKVQYDRLVELSAAIMNTYTKITVESIVGHCDIAPDRKTDPGAAFDWQTYREALEGVLRGET